ncbi:MAG: DNA topoisomerase I [Candidatus Methanophagaceae archaeon]|nr:MAG: DNA topoisomerase I [Methanophagales archaeon]
MHYIITEKGTTAKRIASILSGGKAKKVKIGKIDAYEFGDKVVVGLSGHVFRLDFPDSYNDWTKIDPYKLIDAEIVEVALKKDLIKALERIAKDADAVTIATDYDREGELIGVEALNVLKRVKPELKVDRMRYSAITEQAIKESFAARTVVDYNLADSAKAREMIDLIWGAALTRFVSLAANRLGDGFFSVGRVQSPTLALLVDKEKEIARFIPRKYWELHATLRTENGETFTATHKRGKFWALEDAENAKKKLESAKEGVISELKKRLRRDNPPTPFDTTSFIRAASSIGFTPRRAMNIAESLYLQGLISYHRTDNTTYPETLDLNTLVGLFKSSAEFGEYATLLLKKKQLKPTAGKKKTTDHPPIHPVSVIARDKLDKDEWKVYELVVRRFLATLSDAAKWEDTAVKVELGGEELEAKGHELKQPGFLAVYPYQKKEKEISKLPALREGEKVWLEDLKLVEKETKPPNRISQAGLIKKMEELGLGTKSTRHEIIGKLYERAYVEGNPSRPTEKAFALIDSLEKYAAMMTKPDMTRALEQEMDWISEGKRKKEEVVEESREMLKAVFQEMADNREEIAKSLKEAVKADKIVGTCPECGANLFWATSRRGKRFIGCSNYPECNFSLPLPPSGRVIVTRERCDVHPTLFKLKILKKSKGKTGRAWDFGCPYCNYLQWKNKNNNNNKDSKEKGEDKDKKADKK